jgi:Fic family protein
MEEFIKFHDESKNIAIHPIMISCRLHASLAHIHPFYDGNGRMSRSIMAQYLVRNGYIPAIFHQVNREDYINSLRKIQKGKNASSLYDIVISDILSSYHVYNSKL